MRCFIILLLFPLIPLLGIGQELTIGDTYQGGIIFWLNGDNSGGLIAAPFDQSTLATWGCQGTCYSGSGGCGWDCEGSSANLVNQSPANLGGGAQNTVDMLESCSSSTAASVCLNLILGGYSDWYLPDIYELNTMYLNIGQGNSLGLGNIGGFGDYYYWSSSYQNCYLRAWGQNFDSGYISYDGKSASHPVRAIRAFTFTTGCTDSNAENYDANAIIDDESCSYCSLTSTVTTYLPSSLAACDGSITVTPTSGTGPYNYSWSNDNTTNENLNLCNTTYTYSVTDQDNCYFSETINLMSNIGCTNPQSLNYDINAIEDDGSCMGCLFYNNNKTFAGSNECFVALISDSILNQSATAYVNVYAVGSNSAVLEVPYLANDLVQIDLSYTDVIGLKSDGTVLLWGSSYGVGEFVHLDDISARYVSMSGTGGGNNGFPLIILDDGTIYEGGDQFFNDQYMQLDDGTIIEGSDLFFGDEFIQIEGGSNYVVGLKSDGTVVTGGSISDSPTDLYNVVEIAAGDQHILALKTDGTMVAWGTDVSNSTVIPPFLNDIVSIEAGDNRNIALRSDGSIWVWGEVSQPDWDLNSIPNSVSDVIAVETSGNGFNAVLRSNGQIISWVAGNASGLSSINGVTINPLQFVDCNGNTEYSGCMDESSCNYNVNAANNDACIYPEEYYNCDGNPLNDSNGNGVPDELEDEDYGAVIDSLQNEISILQNIIDTSVYGDVNCDGEVNSQDSALILQYIVGLIEDLPYGDLCD